MHMLNRIAIASTLGAILVVPLFSYAQSNQASYRYNRITAEYTVNANGTVDVAEFFTMYYEGVFRSAWRIIPTATSTASTTSTTATNIVVYDGSTGKALTRSNARLDSNNPEHWDKYALYDDQPGGTAVEWVYDTADRVHTWVLRYTLHNAVTVEDGRATFSHDIFSGFVAPVDTVEAQVDLPKGASNADARISTTEEHGSYIDRPTDHSFRFRVSDIRIGETVAIQIGWQRPGSPLVSGLRDVLGSTVEPFRDYLVGAFFGCLIFAGGMHVWKRRNGRSSP